MKPILETLLAMHWTASLLGIMILAMTGIVLRLYCSDLCMRAWAGLTATYRIGMLRISEFSQRAVNKTAVSLIGVVEPQVNRDIGTGRLLKIASTVADRVVEIDRYQQSARTQLDAAEYSINHLLCELSQIMALPIESSVPESEIAVLVPVDQPIAAIAA